MTESTTNAGHYSVMLAESVDGLAIRQDGIYVDCTFGRGGHSRTIFESAGAGWSFDGD